MAQETTGTASAAAGEGRLEDDVLVPPSNDPRAMADTPLLENSRILIGAMVPTAPAGNALYTLVQTVPNGPFPPASDVEKVNSVAYTDVLAGSTVGDGRLGFVATRQADGGVDLILQNMGESQSGPTHPLTGGAEWDPPLDLGHPPDTVLSALQIGRDSAGRIAIFGLSETGETWWIFRNPPKVVERTVSVVPPGSSEPIEVTVQELAPADPPFSDWQKLAGVALSQLVMTNNADGRVILLGITASSGESDLVFNEPRAMNPSHPSDWLGWETVAADALTPFTRIAAAIDDEGAVNAFAVDSLSQVSHSRQDPPGGTTWSGYNRPGFAAHAITELAAGLDGNGNVALAGISSDGSVSANLEAGAKTQRWSGWQGIAAAPASGTLRLQFNADGRLTLFGLSQTSGDATGMVWAITQAGFDSTEWSARPATLLDEAVSFVALRDVRIPAPA